MIVEQDLLTAKGIGKGPEYGLELRDLNFGTVVFAWAMDTWASPTRYGPKSSPHSATKKDAIPLASFFSTGKWYYRNVSRMSIFELASSVR